jgi:hypothetical protein
MLGLRLVIVRYSSGVQSLMRDVRRHYDNAVGSQESMSLPSAVFLDTSILAGQQYNFASTAISSFVPVADKNGLRVLLPDPTEREIRRQIRERSEEALKALDEARRRAPFLAKWKHFPPAIGSASVANWEVLRLAMSEWEAFQRQLKMVKLGYDGLDMSKIMSWYDSITPPFREGKKRKEFPDAFALHAIELYAKKNKCVVAVVSEDQDFKLACERSSGLLYFRSLPKLTELFLAEPKLLEELRAAIKSDTEVLEDALLSEASEMSYWHDSTDVKVLKSSVGSVQIHDMTIVAIGDGECTITFEGTLEAEHLLQWTVVDYHEHDIHEIEDWSGEETPISGTAKVGIDMTSKKITSVVSMETDVGEVAITRMPRGSDGDW